MWMQILTLISLKRTRAFDGDLKCLGIFVELLSQLQQFKAASLARFPTATQKRALPRVGHPLRAGLFLKWLTGRQSARLPPGF
jgi:hypothetical protein